MPLNLTNINKEEALKTIADVKQPVSRFDPSKIDKAEALRYIKEIPAPIINTPEQQEQGFFSKLLNFTRFIEPSSDYVENKPEDYMSEDYKTKAKQDLINPPVQKQDKPVDLEKPVLDAFIKNVEVPVTDEYSDAINQQRVTQAYKQGKEFFANIKLGNLNPQEITETIDDLSTSLSKKATELNSYNKALQQQQVATEELSPLSFAMKSLSTEYNEPVKEVQDILKTKESIQGIARGVIAQQANAPFNEAVSKTLFSPEIAASSQPLPEWNKNLQEGIKQMSDFEASLNTSPEQTYSSFVNIGIELNHAGDRYNRELAKTKYEMDGQKSYKPLSMVSNLIEAAQDTKMSQLDKDSYFYAGANNLKSDVAQTLNTTKQQLASVDEQLNTILQQTKTQKLSEQAQFQLENLKAIRTNLQSSVDIQTRLSTNLDNQIANNTKVLSQNIAQKRFLDDKYERDRAGEAFVYFLKNTANIPKNTLDFTTTLKNAITGENYKSFRGNVVPIEDYKPEKFEEAIRNSVQFDFKNTSKIFGLEIPKITGDKIGLFYSTLKVGSESLILGGTGALTSGVGESVINQLGKTFGKKLIPSLAVSEATGSLAAAGVNALGRSVAAPVAFSIDAGIGYITPSILLFGNESIKNELAKGQDLQEATRLGIIRSGIEGLTERINPLEMNLIKGRILTGEIRNLGEDVAFRTLMLEKGMSPKLFNALYKSGRIVARGLQQGGLETVEEEIGLFLNDLVSKNEQLKDASYVNSEPFNVENAMNTALLTMATMAPMSVVGGYKQAVSDLKSLQYSRYLVGSSPDLYLSQIGQELSDGIINKEQALEKAQRVNELNNIYKNAQFQIEEIQNNTGISEQEKKQAIVDIFQNTLEFDNLYSSLENQPIEEAEKTLEKLDKLATEREEYLESLKKQENFEYKYEQIQNERAFVEAINEQFNADKIGNTEDIDVLTRALQGIEEQLNEVPEEKEQITLALEEIKSNIEIKLEAIRNQTPTIVVDENIVVPVIPSDDVPVESLRTLPDISPTPSNVAFDILDAIDFTDQNSVNAGISDILQHVNNKFIPEDKIEQVLSTKSRLIGNNDYYTKDYLEKYIALSLKDFKDKNVYSLLGREEEELSFSNAEELLSPRERRKLEIERRKQEELLQAQQNHSTEDPELLEAIEEINVNTSQEQLNLDLQENNIAPSTQIIPEPSDILIEEENNSIVNTIGETENDIRIDGGIQYKGALLVSPTFLAAYQAREFDEVENPDTGYTQFIEKSNEINPQFVQLHSNIDFPIGKALRIRVQPIENSQYLQETKQQFRDYINEKSIFIPKSIQQEDLNDDNNFRDIQVLDEDDNVLFNIHSLSYIRPNRILSLIETEEEQINNLLIQYNALKEFRRSLVEKTIQLEQNNQPVEIPVIISGKSTGQPLLNKTKEFIPVNQAFSNKKVLDSIEVLSNSNTIGDAINTLSTGDVGILLPTPNGKNIALKLGSQKLTEEYITSITSAIRYFTEYKLAQQQRNKAKLVQLDEQLGDEFFNISNIDIRTADGIKQYVQLFVNANYKENDFVNGVNKETISKIPFIDFNPQQLQLTYSTARIFDAALSEDSPQQRLQKIGINKINLISNKGEINPFLNQFLNDFHSFLKNRRVNFDANTSKTTGTFSLPLISSSYTITPNSYKSYKEFMQTHATTNQIEQEYTNKQGNKEYIYFVQPNIEIALQEQAPIVSASSNKEDVDFVFEQSPELAKIGTEEVSILFKKSPKLAKQVYDVLGFRKKNVEEYEDVIDKQTYKFIERIQQLENWKLEPQKINVKSLDSFIKKITAGSQKNMYEVITYEDGEVILQYFDTIEKGINEILDYSDYYTREYNNILFKNENDRNEYLDKEIQKVVDKATENENFKEYYSETLGVITPQQKEKALQLYSEYLTYNEKFDIEGFRQFVNPTASKITTREVDGETIYYKSLEDGKLELITEEEAKNSQNITRVKEKNANIVDEITIPDFEDNIFSDMEEANSELNITKEDTEC